MRPPNNLEKNFFRHIFKSSASRYGSSVPQLFRATTGIQTGPDAFDKSRLVMTFLTNVEVPGILCSFIQVLEGKVVKQMSESSRLVLVKVFSKQFYFIRCTRKRLRAIESRRYSIFTFVDKHNKQLAKSYLSQVSWKCQTLLF